MAGLMCFTDPVGKPDLPRGITFGGLTLRTRDRVRAGEPLRVASVGRTGILGGPSFCKAHQVWLRNGLKDLDVDETLHGRFNGRTGLNDREGRTGLE